MTASIALHPAIVLTCCEKTASSRDKPIAISVTQVREVKLSIRDASNVLLPFLNCRSCVFSAAPCLNSAAPSVNLSLAIRTQLVRLQLRYPVCFLPFLYEVHFCCFCKTDVNVAWLSRSPSNALRCETGKLLSPGLRKLNARGPNLRLDLHHDTNTIVD